MYERRDFGGICMAAVPLSLRGGIAETIVTLGDPEDFLATVQSTKPKEFNRRKRKGFDGEQRGCGPRPPRDPLEGQIDRNREHISRLIEGNVVF